MLAKNHLINNDKVPFTNLTNNEKKGYCSLMQPNEIKHVQYVLGLEKEEQYLGIRINGFVEIALDDVLLIMGNKYKVTNIKASPRQDLARKRIDFKDFQGKTEVLLQG